MAPIVVDAARLTAMEHGKIRNMRAYLLSAFCANGSEPAIVLHFQRPVVVYL